ncbi:S-adenosyl-L-methionine dependent methyltransferase [Hysterangium stoloniferum]|nr:S-adenosyl-L-methionine dependent methyltransferase [Hysterangium stoloniferum]
MHSRNPYIKPPDFLSLSDSFPPLKPFVSISTAGKYVIDFKNPQAQRALTQALLKKDFGLTLDIPEDRLCPPVPNRLNYILWIQEILVTFPTATSGSAPKIHGLDIGTGATAIYPLLGCSLPGNQNWTFIGTEIDPVSCSYATLNVSNNNLTSRIEIYPIITKSISTESSAVQDDDILAPLLNDPTSRFDFTMCNPPFYGSTAEIEHSAGAKEGPPSGACTGAETEMITPGGEESFVLKMIHESTRENVRTRCRWFTSMLGKLGSVGTVVAEFRKLEIDNYIIAQFIQGETRRWAVGWSFGVDRLPDSLARPSGQSLASFLPLPTTLRHTIAMLPSEAKTTLSQVLTSMDTSPVDHQSTAAMVPIPDSVEMNEKGSADAAAPNSSQLVCRISPMAVSQATTSVGVTLEAQWIKGDSRTMFEGFWSHICRKLKDKERHRNFK